MPEGGRFRVQSVVKGEEATPPPENLQLNLPVGPNGPVKERNKKARDKEEPSLLEDFGLQRAEQPIQKWGTVNSL
ncbi:unnamed protein product [Caenorhabditis auriculariae]|uniref:Uncharacterized protein n=1 Tax=Caenorhabditis auriculariae TaxID=2777116 RepID=A0A8S1HB56_9PELO|nr:unnamed protein product [Caenorhabditis auriculariae]